MSALVVILFWAVLIPAQSQSNVQSQLESTYKGEHFLLRNFYAGDDLEYDQDGVLRSGKASEGPWTLAGVEITGVTPAAGGLDIRGYRMAVLYRDGRPGFVRIGNLKIHAARLMTSTDTAAAFDPIFGHVFIKTESEDLRPVVPEYWRCYLSGNDLKSRLAAWQASIDESAVRTFKGAGNSANKITPPRLLDSPEPGYTQEAESRHIEGISHLGVVIDAEGKPAKIAILAPLGMGLDDQAVQAVTHWKFSPAMSNGESVQVQIDIEIKFKCCP